MFSSTFSISIVNKWCLQKLSFFPFISFHSNWKYLSCTFIVYLIETNILRSSLKGYFLTLIEIGIHLFTKLVYSKCLLDIHFKMKSLASTNYHMTLIIYQKELLKNEYLTSIFFFRVSSKAFWTAFGLSRITVMAWLSDLVTISISYDRDSAKIKSNKSHFKCRFILITSLTFC